VIFLPFPFLICSFTPLLDVVVIFRDSEDGCEGWQIPAEVAAAATALPGG
jgi:hypothetical protein